MDLERKEFKRKVAGRELALEVSKLAEQANAAVLATYGGTVALVAVVMGDQDSDVDYMPLTVDYEERFYAAGKILGSRFVRREGRPSEEAILSGRLIDRTLRSLFDKRIRRPIQVVTTILSYDEENDPDFVALMAASTALTISDIPWGGPVAGVRIMRRGGKTELNPANEHEEPKFSEGDFDAFFAGTAERVNMIELGGYNAKEDDIAAAMDEAHAIIQELVAFQNEVGAAVGKPKAALMLRDPDPELAKKVKDFLDGRLEKAVYVADKTDRSAQLRELKEALRAELGELGGEEMRDVDAVFAKELDDLVHRNVLESDRRPDGRALDEVRPLYSEVGVLPRAHGSALFVRGNTQALAATTLGSPGAEQIVETIEHTGKKRFMLHYNFPGFSVGEARSFRGPGRRDIGHGALAEKAIRPLLPEKEEFPYTIRVVSEILSSNGSSSMATVSAASLSLMDAGVPLKSPAAGIAMGLITGQGGVYKILTDIQGPEDHYGDMDFKVAGTREGVNAIQMDVKIDGITREILEKALAQAKKARLAILDATDKTLHAPRPELSPLAPRILSLKIDPAKIGEVIGSGGKVIHGIIETTGVSSVDIDDDGTVYITSEDAVAAERAKAEVEAIVKEFEVGEVVEGEVVKILDFGAIVDLGGGKTGLAHISELKDQYVEDVGSVLKVGDKVKAKIIKMENGKTSLSLKQVEGK